MGQINDSIEGLTEFDYSLNRGCRQANDAVDAHGHSPTRIDKDCKASAAKSGFNGRDASGNHAMEMLDLCRHRYTGRGTFRPTAR